MNRIYLDATVASEVTLRDGPRVVRLGPSTVMAPDGVVFACAVLALLLLIIDQSVVVAMERKRI